jgi:hypothetical protein
MITQLARSDGLALRARRPRAVGTGRTEELKSECDETSYTYQQERRFADVRIHRRFH